MAAPIVDVICVLLFAALGRRSHAESPTLIGLFTTAWPFVAGAVLGWVVASWVFPAARGTTLQVGALVWAGALGAGMALRVLTGQSVAPSFVLVAALVLGAFLLGWRLLLSRLN